METNKVQLEFVPQKQIKYNQFLPYSEHLDKESLFQLSEIKTNLGLAVQHRDIKIAGTHWTGQLAKYCYNDIFAWSFLTKLQNISKYRNWLFDLLIS